MFSQKIFHLIQQLLFSRWARGYEEHHGACEDAYAARLGPLHLELNRCFVLDHDDASVSIKLPFPGGKLHLGYVMCLGTDEIRRPGFYAHWQKSYLQLRSAQLPKVAYGQARQPTGDDEIPF